MLSTKIGPAMLVAAITAISIASAHPVYAEPDDSEEIAVEKSAGSADPSAAGDSEHGSTSESAPNKLSAPSETTEDASGTSEGNDEPAEAKAEPAAVKPDKLTVASWGGAYGESQRRAYFTPFQSESGIEIEAVSHNGKFDALDPENTDRPEWDVIDVSADAIDRACQDGWLEKVDITQLSAANDGTRAQDDFFPDSLHECGIPSVAWSSAIVFDKRAFKKRTPNSAKDFFDVKRFPGKRALPRGAKYSLELALLADGVEPDEVYSVLATDDGVEQAFRKLETIRDHIVWWNRANEPLSLLEKQQVAIAVAFNGRIFSAIVGKTRPFGIIWDGQVFDLDLWAIPKGTPNAKAALDFIAFATQPAQLAQQAGWFPYGPMRKSAVEMVGRHPEVDVDMSAFIPTSKPNFKRALRLNSSWWQENEDRMKDRFKVWLIGDGGSADSGLDAESENTAR
ncbi:MAG: polyamine ABC transporter substrate-binding protein [Hyphomicrobiaceae bacterium]|nr:polyamine ABC transporter substrate-binding protein [Hyphomicrobiaceae bacterium]